jgi:2-oxo-3-(phosphooxy)propyl 3-oxoalkanoate synthase
MITSSNSSSDRLRRSSLVPRDLVHRSAPAGVLLTDVRQTGDDAFLAAAHWPRSHPTFDRSGDGRHNPLMVAETLRQLGLCVPLGFYGVGPDAHFLIEQLAFDVDPDAEPHAGYGGSEIVCEATADMIRPGGGRPLRGFRIRVRFQADGSTFAEAAGLARVLTPAAFAMVRRAGPAVERSVGLGAVDPRALGVSQASDVLIAVDRLGVTRLHAADPLHPFFFDHASDHVPGVVLIEAARQAAALLEGRPGLRLAGFAITASHFTESAPDAVVECRRAGALHVFEFVQGDHTTASGSLRAASA